MIDLFKSLPPPEPKIEFQEADLASMRTGARAARKRLRSSNGLDDLRSPSRGAKRPRSSDGSMAPSTAASYLSPPSSSTSSQYSSIITPTNGSNHHNSRGQHSSSTSPYHTSTTSSALSSFNQSRSPSTPNDNSNNQNSQHSSSSGTPATPRRSLRLSASISKDSFVPASEVDLAELQSLAAKYKHEGDDFRKKFQDEYHSRKIVSKTRQPKMWMSKALDMYKDTIKLATYAAEMSKKHNRNSYSSLAYKAAALSSAKRFLLMKQRFSIQFAELERLSGTSDDVDQVLTERHRIIQRNLKSSMDACAEETMSFTHNWRESEILMPQDMAEISYESILTLSTSDFFAYANTQLGILKFERR